jgi:TatD DNase family protein
MFIDIHCHIEDNTAENIDKIVNAYLSDGVKRVINAGANLSSSIKSSELASKYESVYFVAGVHPSDIEELNDEVLLKLSSLASQDKCLAIGEIGLDYHFLPFDKEKQIKGFISQIELANRLDLPVVVHSRDATKDTLDILKANPVRRGGVMHCFSGSKETALEYIKMGFYISFGGTLTFKNASVLKEVAKALPLDKILTETDIPYLRPHPFRGTVNQPKNVSLVAGYLSELLALPLEQVSSAVMQNAKRLFYKLK